MTEYTIDCLKLPYLTGDVQAQRKEIYQNFWKEGEGKTAGQIYESLSQYSDTEIKNWERIFASDSHELWRKLTEEEIEGLKTQWEKIIAKTGSEGGFSKNKAGMQKGTTKEWYELQKKKRRVIIDFYSVFQSNGKKYRQIWIVLIIFRIIMDSACTKICRLLSL